MATLVHIGYSPWSEKARWAIDHHGIDVERREHLLLVGEAALRLRARKLRGKVSVPLLLDGDGGDLGDSFAIARWAEARGGGPPLFPAGKEAEVETWNRRSEAVLYAGRVRTAARVVSDPEALRESLPALFRNLGPASAAFGRLGARFLSRKYGYEVGEEALRAHEQTMREELARLVEALGGGDYLLGGFSYADVAMAVALQFVSPVADEFIRLGERSRAAWTEPELSKTFGDLLAWRDRVYARHR